MPRITIKQMPSVTRAGRTSVWEAQMAELTELLSDDEARKTDALSFEVEKDNLDGLVSSLRKAGQKLERKVATVYRDGVLYAQDGGIYVGKSGATKVKVSQGETPGVRKPGEKKKVAAA